MITSKKLAAALYNTISCNKIISNLRFACQYMIAVLPVLLKAKCFKNHFLLICLAPYPNPPQ